MVRISYACLLVSYPEIKYAYCVNTISLYIFLYASWFLGVCYIPVHWTMPGEQMALMQLLHRYQIIFFNQLQFLMSLLIKYCYMQLNCS